MSLEELAKKIGREKRQSVYKWEAGRSPVPEKDWEKLADALGRSVADLQTPLETFRGMDIEGAVFGASVPARQGDAIMSRSLEALRSQRMAIDESRLAPANPIAGYIDRQETGWRENAALAIRRKWGLGWAPISDLAATLRDFGVILIQNVDPSRTPIIWGGHYDAFPFLVIEGRRPASEAELADYKFNLTLTLVRTFIRSRPKWNRIKKEDAEHMTRALLLPRRAVEHYFPATLKEVDLPARVGYVSGRFGLPGHEILNWLAELRPQLLSYKLRRRCHVTLRQETSGLAYDSGIMV